jgi:hypothetical protein
LTVCERSCSEIKQTPQSVKHPYPPQTSKKFVIFIIFNCRHAAQPATNEIPFGDLFYDRTPFWKTNGKAKFSLPPLYT